MELSELIAAVGVSVQQAQSRVERTAAEEYLGYFRAPGENGAVGGEGALVPWTVEVSLPGEDGQAAPVAVPVVALVNHNPMRLEQVRVRMNIVPALTEGGGVEVSAAPAGEEGNSLELTFRAGEAGEAAARIGGTASRLL